MKARHKKVADERNLNIAMDAEIAKIYQASTAVSVSKGNSHNLMKMTAKRRRSRKQIEEEKLDEEMRLAEVEAKLARFAQMEQAFEGLNQKINQAEGAMTHLFEHGLIK